MRLALLRRLREQEFGLYYHFRLLYILSVIHYPGYLMILLYSQFRFLAQNYFHMIIMLRIKLFQSIFS